MNHHEEQHIEKLIDAESFHLWKFEITIYLKSHGLGEITNGEAKTEGKLDEQKDAKGQKIILQTIDKKLKSHILYCKSAREMYRKLCDLFEGSESRNKSKLLQEFFNYKYNKQTVNQLVTGIENLAVRLNNLGHKIDDDLIMSKILTCLPERFKYFATAWESTPNNEKTLINLTNRLLLEETRNSNCEEEIAFKAVNNKKCFKCNKTGHFQSQCKVCNICKKSNHQEKDCRFKNKNKQCSICKKTNHVEQNCFFRNKNNKKENKDTALLTNETANKNNKLKFIVDSGSTSHMTNNINILSKYEEQPSQISVANNDTIQSQGAGTVQGMNCQLLKTLYVPDLAQNLLSVNSVTNNNGTVLFTQNNVKIYKKGQLVLKGEKENGLYYININQDNHENTLFLAKEKGTALEWHRRLGHPGKDILEILPNMADGILLEGNKRIEQCEICIKAKQTRLPFTSERKRAERPLQIIHTDICGPFDKLTHDGNRYFITILDDYSHITKTYLMKHKNEAFTILKEYIEEKERKKNEKVSCIRCDNGGEYRSNELKTWCSNKGIKLDYTIPYTPQLNGKAERLNRTILEKVRALLFDSNMKDEMWGEAVYCATYLLNRLPSKTLNNKTPYEMWYKTKPDISNIQVFGCTVYAKQLGPVRKLDPRSKRLTMIGYANNGYRLWNNEKKRVEIHRDIIIFNENKEDKIKSNEENKIIQSIINTEENTINTEENIINIEENIINIEEDIINTEEDIIITEENIINIEENIINTEENVINVEEDIINTEEENLNLRRPVQHIEEQNIDIPNTEPGIRRSKRTTKIPEKLKDYVLLTYKEATTGEEKENWEKAIDSEKESLKKNKTWSLVDISEAGSKKILTNKWVFRVKDDGTYKARLVVRGFEQRGIDFDEIYSPVVSQSALKSLFAIAASKNSEIVTFDVKTAFLYGELDDDIYMCIPDGYDKEPNKICKLNKALYGLKQAPITWNKTFTKTMLKLGLIPTKTDRCVFTNTSKSVIIAIYVDDGLAISTNKTELDNILNCLELQFQIKIFKNPKNFVGLEICKDDTGISLKQETYIQNLLKNFNMIDAKPTSIPCNINKETDAQTNMSSQQINFPYRECVGGLLYLSTRTRPDIAEAVNKASRKIENPSQTDVIAVKKILRYLAGTRDKGIKYLKGGNINMLNAYCDSDYANDVTTRRSTTGFVIMFSNGPISWCSKRQPIVTLSSTEAEYIAAADCCKETLYLKSLLCELLHCKINITLNIDNQSSIQLIKTGSFNKRSKHIDVRYYFIHEHFIKGNIIVNYCPTDQQVADIFTKPLGKVKFEAHCNRLIQ